MEEHVGAYIIDPDGNAVPDLSDEAMAARQAQTGLKSVCVVGQASLPDIIMTSKDACPTKTQKEMEVKDA